MQFFNEVFVNLPIFFSDETLCQKMMPENGNLWLKLLYIGDLVSLFLHESHLRYVSS